MKSTITTAVRIISPISIVTALTVSSFLVPNSTHAQNADALRTCIDSLMYKPRTYPQQATGITAEAAAIACRNTTSASPEVSDALRTCIDSLMYKPRTYPQQATGITAEAAAIACRNPAPHQIPVSPQPRGILTAPLR